MNPEMQLYLKLYNQDLLTWKQAGPVIGSEPTSDEQVELLQVRALNPSGPGPRFMRIRVDTR